MSIRYYRVFCAWIGVLLGLGAPFGAFLWRLTFRHQDSLHAWFLSEWNQSSWFYVYMMVGCVVVFSGFGALLGHHMDRLKADRDDQLKHAESNQILANTDGLTGIYNHRYLQEQLNREMERTNRYETPLSCLMIDVDDFKHINDTYGHLYGDQVLLDLAEEVQTQTRTIDVVGRYGGEEFLVIMPEATEDVAFSAAERIRTSVSKHIFVVNGTRIHLTISIGVATYPSPGLVDKPSFLLAVDQALYEAKRLGKNRTFLSRELKRKSSSSVTRLSIQQ